jgi:hypothetical protein
MTRPPSEAVDLSPPIPHLQEHHLHRAAHVLNKRLGYAGGNSIDLPGMA